MRLPARRTLRRAPHWAALRAPFAVLLLACLLTLAPETHAGGDPRRPVAEIEVSAPSSPSFVLRATLPIPKGVFPRADGRSPFAVRTTGSGPKLAPAQVETVAFYPTGEADVVELLARVELPPRSTPGRPVRYEIVHSEAGFDPASETPPVPDSVRDLLETPGRILLRARDVFGNTYVADLAGHPGPGQGGTTWLREGPIAWQRRTYSTLVPTGIADDPAKAPLPHLMGVHAYITEWADEDVISLDLRINNGAIAGSKKPSPLEAPLGIVYWESLDLIVPAAWSVVAQIEDPFFGTPADEAQADKPRGKNGRPGKPGKNGNGRRGRHVIPIVRANADGSMHMMPPQAQFHRRLALVPSGGEARARKKLQHEGLGFCVRDRKNRYWSWFNPLTARYFPQRDLLASYDFYRLDDLRGRYAARVREAREYLELRNGLRTGQAQGNYVTAKVMGWAHPWYIRHGYGFGGEGIRTYEGHRVAASASREGYIALEFLHRMNACRQPETAYDRNGEVVGYHSWLDDGRIPFDFRTHGGIVMPPFRLTMNYGAQPSAHVRYVLKHGLRPRYDRGTPFKEDGSILDEPTNLHAWWPHDGAHLIRFTKNAKALVWLGNDALAKDDLFLSAELFRLMFHESPHERVSWSEGTTLRVLEKLAKRHPHQGVPMGREHGWGIDAMAAAYSLADDEWRTRNLAWFGRVARLCLAAAQPSGLIQRMENERLFDARYHSTQAFESLFMMHGLHCINESVLRGVDDDLREELEQLVVRGTDYLYWGPPFDREKASWQPNPRRPTIFYQGPRNYIAVARNDGWKTPVFSDEDHWGSGYLPSDGLESGIEYFHCWQALSYAHQITNGRAGTDLGNRYLRRLLDCWIPHKDYSALLDDLHDQASDPSFDNSPNWIGLVGKLQTLDVR